MELTKMNATIMSKFGQSGAAFSFALMELAESHPEVIVLSSDMSTPAGLDKFKKTYPDRFFNVGIAEQNLVGIASGLASEGWTPIIVAQACFVTMRSFEQVRQYCGNMGFPIIIVGYGAGFCLQFMGNTHYSIEDISLMRSIPGMTVVSPADAGEAAKLLAEAVNYKRPIYIRLTDKMGCPVVYYSEYECNIGKPVILKEGAEVQIIATGSMVSRALKAAEIMSASGIDAAVVNMHTVKPLDGDAICKTAKLIVTVEEHSIIGGLGSAVSEWMVDNRVNVPILKIGVKDCFSQVGDYDFLLEQHGLTPELISETIIKQLKK